MIEATLELFKQAYVPKAGQQQCEATVSFLELFWRSVGEGTQIPTPSLSVLHAALDAFVHEVQDLGFLSVHHHAGSWDVSVTWKDPGQPSTMGSEEPVVSTEAT